jgi:hypothetical protein
MRLALISFSVQHRVPPLRLVSISFPAIIDGVILLPWSGTGGARFLIQFLSQPHGLLQIPLTFGGFDPGPQSGNFGPGILRFEAAQTCHSLFGGLLLL